MCETNTGVTCFQLVGWLGSPPCPSFFAAVLTISTRPTTVSVAFATVLVDTTCAVGLPVSIVLIAAVPAYTAPALAALRKSGFL